MTQPSNADLREARHLRERSARRTFAAGSTLSGKIVTCPTCQRGFSDSDIGLIALDAELPRVEANVPCVSCRGSK